MSVMKYSIIHLYISALKMNQRTSFLVSPHAVFIQVGKPDKNSFKMYHESLLFILKQENLEQNFLLLLLLESKTFCYKSIYQTE